MPSVSDWKVPSAVQPKPGDYGYDLERALSEQPLEVAHLQAQVLDLLVRRLG